MRPEPHPSPDRSAGHRQEQRKEHTWSRTASQLGLPALSAPPKGPEQRLGAGSDAARPATDPSYGQDSQDLPRALGVGLMKGSSPYVWAARSTQAAGGLV